MLFKKTLLQVLGFKLEKMFPNVNFFYRYIKIFDTLKEIVGVFNSQPFWVQMNESFRYINYV